MTAFIDPDCYYSSRRGRLSRLGRKPDAHQAARDYLNADPRLAADPVVWFSNSYYLSANPDVFDAGVNPLVHYVRHGQFEDRKPLPYLYDLTCEMSPLDIPVEVAQAAKTLTRHEFLKLYGSGLDGWRPLVSAIVPNYNHGRFLAERFDSILDQGYTDIEVIALDDCSTDNSRNVINSYAKRNRENFRFLPNEVNSGNVFKQWRKGFEEAQGELIWICESDDTAERDFLDEIVPMFADMSVQIAFGRTQFADEHGFEQRGLDGHRESTEPGIWNAITVRPAAEWFAKAFSVKNIIPNVGGCLIRRQPVTDAEWSEAAAYSVLGDWYLYLTLARGGQLAYNPNAVTYFRQHGANTSTNYFSNDNYYREHANLGEAIRRNWDVPDETTWAFYRQLASQYTRTHSDEPAGELVNLVSMDRLLSTDRSAIHVLIGFQGFQVGGGEFYPIHLANALRASGVQVSMLALDLSERSDAMYDLLDRRIPVYSTADVRSAGPDAFVRNAGIDIIHSHHLGVELLFHESDDEVQTLSPGFPYIASLHGTYEVTDLSEHRISRACRGVTHWAYTTGKNLAHLESRSWHDGHITHMANATPVNPEPWPLTRAEMGIADDAFVYCLIARPLAEKGWAEAITATVELAEEQPGSETHLLLVGDGEEKDVLEKQWSDHPSIHFLGYQTNVHGILRFSDCCLLPTRFVGESYPLILIQAIQTGTAIVATDAGEIGAMLHGSDFDAGLTIDWITEDRLFVDHLKAAMLEVRKPDTHQRLTAGAKAQAPNYDMDRNASAYLQMYHRELNRLRAGDDVLNLDDEQRRHSPDDGRPAERAERI